jgi:hypothetical protein
LLVFRLHRAEIKKPLGPLLFDRPFQMPPCDYKLIKKMISCKRKIYDISMLLLKYTVISASFPKIIKYFVYVAYTAGIAQL